MQNMRIDVTKERVAEAIRKPVNEYKQGSTVLKTIAIAGGVIGFVYGVSQSDWKMAIGAPLLSAAFCFFSNACGIVVAQQHDNYQTINTRFWNALR